MKCPAKDILESLMQDKSPEMIRAIFSPLSAPEVRELLVEFNNAFVAATATATQSAASVKDVADFIDGIENSRVLIRYLIDMSAPLTNQNPEPDESFTTESAQTA